MLQSRILSYFPNGGVEMKYYMYAENQTVQMLREILEGGGAEKSYVDASGTVCHVQNSLFSR